jgi:FMN phosphatase YigB (HAD superfamily)
VRAVLFDLDGTLLDLDLRSFLGRYFEALEVASSPLIAKSPGAAKRFMEAMNASVAAMMDPHPDRTNEQVFYEQLHQRTGVDLHEHWPLYERFYAEVFPTLRDTARPAAGGRETVETALRLGLSVGIATNPIFPRSAIEQRLDWAGLADLALPVVTTYESMLACKPHPEYFRQTAALLGADPRDCLMVGDDRLLDLPAADVGMRTYYVGPDTDATADMRGSLAELAELLPKLV